MAVKQTAGRNSLGDLAPKFAELNDDVLFGEVWSREDKLSLRDRCIVTVTALMAKGITDNSIKYHIENAKNHGVTKTEMVEIITHAAFYVGWPNAWAIFPMVREAYAEEKDGCSDSLFGLVEPKCRNNWHIHHKGGQILLCTDGEGWYQEWGQPARKLHPGDVVYIAPEIKHWHGATKDEWFTHVALEIPAEGASNEWCEPVSDEQYNAL